MDSPRKQAQTKMQEDYVQARLAGKTRTESKRLSGYSEGTKPNDIERPGGPIEERIKKSLEAKGITWDSLADEYVTGIKGSKSEGAKDRDFNAHAKYLLQLGYLLGGGKKAPGVAIQINNNSGGNPEQEPGHDIIGRLEALVERLESQASIIDVPRVLPGDTGDADPKALHGMEPPSSHAEGNGSGGGA